MLVTVIKCPVTGTLFEDKAEYKKHQNRMKTANAEKARNTAKMEAAKVIAEKMRNATSLQEYFKLFNELEIAKAKKSSCSASILGVRLVAQSPLVDFGRGCNEVRVSVDVFQGKGSFGTSGLQESPCAPGFNRGCGNGGDARGDAPAGSRSVTRFQALLDLTKLPGLQATYAGISHGRKNKKDIQVKFSERAHVDLLSKNAAYANQAHTVEELEQSLQELMAKVTSAQTALVETRASMAGAVESKAESLLLADLDAQEALEALAALETQLKVA